MDECDKEAPELPEFVSLLARCGIEVTPLVDRQFVAAGVDAVPCLALEALRLERAEVLLIEGSLPHVAERLARHALAIQHRLPSRLRSTEALVVEVCDGSTDTGIRFELTLMANEFLAAGVQLTEGVTADFREGIKNALRVDRPGPLLIPRTLKAVESRVRSYSAFNAKALKKMRRRRN